MIHRGLLNDAGDTIVEVLIVIAIASLVLSGAFASSSRSLNANRQSQERSEALKLVEGQVERLKFRGKTFSDPIYSTASFCLDTSNNIITPLSAICNSSVLGVTYELSITGAANLFTIRADWDKSGGSGRENIRMLYKLYPKP